MNKLSVLKRNIDLITAFLSPMLILGLAYALFGVYPFGDKTILISDLSGQYLDFYAALHDMLTQGKSLFYSWHAGMGHNFVGIIAYYLLSPLSLLIFLFEKEQLPGVLLFMTLLKIGLSGLTFAVYARFLFKEPKWAIVGFSIIYALMSYSIVYAFNIMWLDGIILLPLVLLGIEKLIREQQGILLGLSLWTLFVANFYIAYMIGIFSCFYWLICYLQHHNPRPWRLIATRFARFMGIALLSAGCAAFVLVPTYFALMNGPNDFVFSQLTQFKQNFMPFDLLTKFPTGAYDSLSYGLPNIAVGLLPLMLIPYFFSSRDIPLQEKIAYLLLLLFFLASFVLSNLNIFWHAFDTPDWFPYRYSFLFSFVLILLAFKTFKTLKPSDAPRLFRIYGYWFFLVILIQKFNYPYISYKVILINLFLLTLYLCVLLLLLKRPSRRQVVAGLLISLIVIEALFNSWYLVRRLNNQFTYVTKTAYAQTMTPLQNLVDRIHTEDPSFFRLERAQGRTHNDALNIGYHGIAHFSSLSNGQLHALLQSLGFAVWANNKVLSYSGSTLVTDSLFAVKYKIAAQPLGFGYKPRLTYTTSDKALTYRLYENSYALPLGFMASKAILEFETSDLNPFELQNVLINRCLGIEPDDRRFVPYFVPLTADQIRLDNLTLHSDDMTPYYQRTDSARDAWLYFRLNNPPSQPIYAILPPGTINIRATVNNRELGGFSAASRIIDLGELNTAQPLNLTYQIIGQTHPYTRYPLYALDTTRFRTSFAALKQRGIQDLLVTSRAVTGRVTANPDEVLFTTIPYDSGWKAFVDGQEVPITKIANAFIGIELSPGTHDIHLTYRPPGLILGLMISGISLVILMIYIKRSVHRHRHN